MMVDIVYKYTPPEAYISYGNTSAIHANLSGLSENSAPIQNITNGGVQSIGVPNHPSHWTNKNQ
jgi:hypothetical protein